MILLYHKVFPESPTMWWVTVDNFYRQMCELQHRKVVYLDEYNIYDPDYVVITFDGVYKNILEYAIPILGEFSFPFELFITGDYIGKDNSFDTPEPKADFLSCEDLRELVKSGGRLQWHSQSHRQLSKISNNKILNEELIVPKNLHDLDKKGFQWFAYPHGDFDDRLIGETRKQFKGALSCDQGNDSDIYKLNRVTVTNHSSFAKNKIAAIVASYNYGHFLIEAIESVLRQTRPVNEILIADDCSTDNTSEISQVYLKKYPKLIAYQRNNTNLGIVKNFNQAVALTASDYICFLGADNRFRSDYIQKASRVLDANDDVGVAYTDFALFGPRSQIVYNDQFPDEWKGPIKENYFYIVNFPDFDNKSRKLLEERNFIHGSSMFRRKAFEKVGGYIEKQGMPEDHNLFLRMVAAGWQAQRVPCPTLEYRQHSRDQVNVGLASSMELNFYKERVRELERVYDSHGGRMLLKYYRIRDTLFPLGTARRKVLKHLLNLRK